MKVKEIFCELELRNLPQTRLYTGVNFRSFILFHHVSKG